MQEVKTYLNDICRRKNEEAGQEGGRKVSDTRREFLSFLWACYGCLPAYLVGADPSKCRFSNAKEFGHNELIKCLSEHIDRFLFEGKDRLTIEIQDGRTQDIILPDADREIT